jgi:hypothetical protein
MSHARPEATCQEIAFASAFVLDDGAEVALVDYARVLARARGAEAVREAGEAAAVRGVHLCDPAAALTAPLRQDVEEFARGLVTGTPGGGLGWS